MTPRRLRRERTRGWRMPEGAIYVGRPSLWGNPWTVREAPDVMWGEVKDGLPVQGTQYEATRRDKMAWAVAKYRAELEHGGLLSDYAYVVSDKVWSETDLAFDAAGSTMREFAAVRLRGHDLVCWCPLDLPCHADLLLEVANA